MTGLVLLLELALRPLLAPGPGRAALVAAQILVVLVVLLSLAGGLVLARMPALAGPRSRQDLPDAASAAAAGADSPEGKDMGVMMGSFSRILGKIEEQGNEINDFAQRLETAYKELEFNNA
ncbi:MAG TPA: hypothetical protein VFG27_04070, partial [Pseudomonadales bacterium]|nr:hypothetical protein [Pseudomonadales bacterium]